MVHELAFINYMEADWWKAGINFLNDCLAISLYFGEHVYGMVMSLDGIMDPGDMMIEKKHFPLLWYCLLWNQKKTW